MGSGLIADGRDTTGRFFGCMRSSRPGASPFTGLGSGEVVAASDHLEPFER